MLSIIIKGVLGFAWGLGSFIVSHKSHGRQWSFNCCNTGGGSAWCDCYRFDANAEGSGLN